MKCIPTLGGRGVGREEEVLWAQTQARAKHSPPIFVAATGPLCRKSELIHSIIRTYYLELSENYI